MFQLKTRITFILIILSISLAFSKFELSPLFSDDMVLQRGKNIKVWGYANPKDEITVVFKSKKYTAITQKDSTWKVELGIHSAGGPYDMLFRCNQSQIYFENISIGDVWICGGQSNMEFTLEQLGIYDSIIQNAKNDNLRLIKVKNSSSETRKKEIISDQNWTTITPNNIRKYSATGYFFGQALTQSEKIPIGLISDNWGGSPAEVWMSEEGLKSFPEITQAYKDNEHKNAYKKSLMLKRKELMPSWVNSAISKDSLSILYDKKLENISFLNWNKTKLPLFLDDVGLKEFDGIVWVGMEFEVSNDFLNKNLKLILGRVDDADETFINGQKVGSIFYHEDEREYLIPSNLLKSGKNTLVIRTVDYGGSGGIETPKGKSFYFIDDSNNTLKLPLEIYFSKGYDITKIEGYIPPDWSSIINWQPSSLYNAMIYPIKDLAIKGVIWYQGESNAGRAYQYRKLFPAMISDWRNAFNDPNLPFLYVQLANFLKPDSIPKTDPWPELREAQTFALMLPNTGMISAIDVGEEGDIHPKNKKTVGERLAKMAQKMVYNKNVVANGPTYSGMKIEGNKIRIMLTNIGSGLVCKNGPPMEFAIAGADQKFYWAEAKIEKNTIVISSKKVQKPVAVRHAWSNNPSKLNVFNKEGFPLLPFRTDDWKLSTHGNWKIE